MFKLLLCILLPRCWSWLDDPFIQTWHVCLGYFLKMYQHTKNELKAWVKAFERHREKNTVWNTAVCSTRTRIVTNARKAVRSVVQDVYHLLVVSLTEMHSTCSVRRLGPRLEVERSETVVWTWVVEWHIQALRGLATPWTAAAVPRCALNILPINIHMRHLSYKLAE